MALALGQAPVGAAEPDLPPADYTVSQRDFGGVGLLQMPTARFSPDGQFDFGATVIDPYIRYNLTWQVLPRLEATFRYTDVRNRLYSDVPAFSGDQTFKDRGADVRFLLVREDKYLPQIALGLQDGLGTGQFGSEFLVFSKRWYDLDFTAGIAWGYLGSSGTIKNPLTLFSNHFKTRSGNFGQGGTFRLGNLFAGDKVGIFGGIEWRTPIDGLMLKLEYDANDYQHEPLGNRFIQDLPLNVGVLFRPYQFLDLGIGYERGNTLMFRVGLRANFHDSGPPKNDPPPAPIKPRPPASQAQLAALEPAPPWWEQGDQPALAWNLDDPGLAERPTPAKEEADRLFDNLERQGVEVETVELNRTDATIVVSRLANGQQVTLTRVAQAVVSAMAEPLRRVTVVETASGREMRRVTVATRDLIEAAIVDHVFDGFEAAGLPVESVDLSETEAVIAVSAPRGLHGIAAAGLITQVLDAVPMPVQRVTIVAHQSGRETGRVSLSRDDARREARLDRLFATLAAQGAEVLSLDFSHRGATLVVAAGAPTPDLKRLGRTLMDGLPAPLEAVTVVAMADGRETARETYEPYAPPARPEPAPARPTLVGAGRDDVRATPLDEAAKRKLADELFAELDAASFRAVAFDLDATTATIWVTPLRYRQVARNVGRAARIVANHVPGEVERIVVALVEGEFETVRVAIMRKDLEQAVALRGSPEEVFAHAVIRGGEPSRPASAIQKPGLYPRLDWGLRPYLVQSVGQPEQFFLYQVNARLTGRVDLGYGFGVEGAINRKLFGTLDKARTPSDASVPHVRSDVRLYIQQAPTALERLAWDWRYQPARDWYLRLTGGIFEDMFGGVGGEVLWWPYGSRLAIGGEMFFAAQRDFDERFTFRDYHVPTGFLNFYYQLPFYELLGEVNVGQYLAGDKGITYRLSRRFDSGITVGAFMTFTNVPFKTFGEGSFDKGFFVSVPFESFLSQSSQRTGYFAFRPLTNDPGQMLGGAGQTLHGLVAGDAASDLARDWRRLLD